MRMRKRRWTIRTRADTKCLGPFALLMMLLALPVMAESKELYTNGIGGGDWSDPATWRGNAVPGENDIAVVGRDDHVVFDRDDTERITCRELHIDPGGSLAFKQQAGRIVARFAGKVASYGAVRMDATRSRNDVMELHVLADKDEDRTITFARSASLIAVGRSDLKDGARNVVFQAHGPGDKKRKEAAPLTVGDGCGIDLRHAHLHDVELLISGVDNTGAEYNERANIEHNLFTGWAHLLLTNCDSPVVTHNTFKRPEMKVNWVLSGAIGLHGCTLADVRGNQISGWYYYGLNSSGSTDIALIDTTVEGAHIGMHWYCRDTMIRNFRVSKANLGLQLNYMTGAIDGLITDSCTTPMTATHASGQISNWQNINETAEQPTIQFHHYDLTLLNCDIAMQQVNLKHFKPLKKRPDTPIVRSMNFVVVQVDGDVPPGAMVHVQTKGFKPPRPGAQDMNVRNSPAPIVGNRMTPRPASMRPIIVQSWQYDAQGKLVPPPTYTLTVKSADGKALKSVDLEPSPKWFRADPNTLEPTVKVVLP